MQVIKHYDEISVLNVLADQKRLATQKARNKSPVLGLVRIYENGKLNTDESEDGWLTNMTIATGREFVGQSIFKKHSSSSIFGDISNYKVDSFGVGSGGSNFDADFNITLNGPALCDVGLYTPIALNTSCLDAPDNNGNVVQHVVKHIETPGPGGTAGEIVFQQSSTADFADCGQTYHTVIRLDCIVDYQEPSYLNPGDSVKIDEAMLFLTSPSNTNPLPFAHICFAPKYVELESAFKVEWYVIC